MASTAVSWASTPSVRRSMQRNRGRDTGPEIRIRAALHRRGLRFFKNRRVAGLPRTEIDIVFPRLKLAVFVDGCYWHGCVEHRGVPATHSEWWGAKLARNRERDAATTSQLEQLGWLVLRVWEHEPVEDAVRRVERMVWHAGKAPSLEDAPAADVGCG